MAEEGGESNEGSADNEPFEGDDTEVPALFYLF